MRQLLAKRCIAYQCILCDYKGEKRYVEGHAMKVHMMAEQAPFYCNLCGFKSRTEKKLQKHTKGYKAHMEALLHLTASGENKPESSFLVRNPQPLKLENFFKKLTVRESMQLSAERSNSHTQSSTSPVTPAPTPIVQTVCNPAPIQVAPTFTMTPAPELVVPTGAPTSQPMGASMTFTKEKDSRICTMTTKTQDKEMTMTEKTQDKEMNIDLPEITEDQKFDLLDEILRDDQGEDLTEFDDKQTEPRVVDLLTKMCEKMDEQTELLKNMNTAIRLNTMAISDLTGRMRVLENQERNRRTTSCPYNQRWRRPTFRRETTRDRRVTVTPRMKSEVVKK